MAGFISAAWRLGKTYSFEKTPQQRQTVANTVSDLTGQGIEPKTSRANSDVQRSFKNIVPMHLVGITKHHSITPHAALQTIGRINYTSQNSKVAVFSMA